MQMVSLSFAQPSFSVAMKYHVVCNGHWL